MSRAFADPFLDLPEAVNDIANAIMDSGLLPQRAVRDCHQLELRIL